MVAVSNGMNIEVGKWDPYLMAKFAVDEAYRNLIAVRRRFRTVVGRRLAPTDVSVDEGSGTVVVDVGSIQVAANLGADPAQVALGRSALAGDVSVLLSNHDAVGVRGREVELPPLSVAVLGPG